MPFEIVPFLEAHHAPAAALLAARHRADQQRVRGLPPAYGESRVAREAIARLCAIPDADGWAALDGDKVAGYLIGKRLVFGESSIEALFLDTKAVTIPFTGYAARTGDPEPVHRALYAAAAERWVGAGFLSHSIRTTYDPSGCEPWFSLGFGRRFGHGIRPLDGAAEQSERPLPAGYAIRRAGPDDRDAVFAIFAAGGRYHTNSPIFLPYREEAIETHRARIGAWLADPQVAIWVAELGGELVGMVQIHPAEGLVEDGIRPEGSAYLFEGHVNPGARGQGVGAALVERGMAWARDAGYPVCVVDWFTANPLSSRFWPRRGFAPFAGQLARRIDPRVPHASG